MSNKSKMNAFIFFLYEKYLYLEKKIKFLKIKKHLFLNKK